MAENRFLGFSVIFGGFVLKFHSLVPDLRFPKPKP